MSPVEPITDRSPENLQATFAERPYSDEDFNSLVRIERHAGAARWSCHQLKTFLTQLEFDTRIVTMADSPDHSIAFFVVT